MKANSEPEARTRTRTLPPPGDRGCSPGPLALPAASLSLTDNRGYDHANSFSVIGRELLAPHSTASLLF